MVAGKLWIRRHAIQIAAQLPEEYGDAIAVLRATERLVNEFLAPDQPPNRVVAITGSGSDRPGDVLADRLPGQGTANQA